MSSGLMISGTHHSNLSGTEQHILLNSFPTNGHTSGFCIWSESMVIDGTSEGSHTSIVGGLSH